MPPATAVGGGDPSDCSFQESVRSLLKGSRRNVLICFEEQTQFYATWANYNHLLFLSFFHPGLFSTWIEMKMTNDFIRSRWPCFPKNLNTSKTKSSWCCLANEKDPSSINFSSFERMIQLLCPPVFEKRVNSFYSVSFLTILSLGILNESSSS